MADHESDIQARLNGYAALTAIVGTRIYAEPGPEDPADSDYPMVVYSCVSDVPESEDVRGVISYYEARYQFSCLAKTKAAAKAVAKQVRDAMQGYHSTYIKASSFLNAPHLYDPDTMTHHIPVDFQISH